MTSEKLFKAEAAYKLAELLALKAEHAAQSTRLISQWHESYGSMADALSLRVDADEKDAWAREQEDKATAAYSYWAMLADNA